MNPVLSWLNCLHNKERRYTLKSDIPEIEKNRYALLTSSSSLRCHLVVTGKLAGSYGSISLLWPGTRSFMSRTSLYSKRVTEFDQWQSIWRLTWAYQSFSVALSSRSITLPGTPTYTFQRLANHVRWDSYFFSYPHLDYFSRLLLFQGWSSLK